MGSKTISIRDEAYRRLLRRKGAGKSFSDVIMELTEADERDFSTLVGADVDVDWERVAESRERSRADDEREELLS